MVFLGAIVLLLIWDAQYDWNWSGFGGKTFWDWFELLIVPAILAWGAILFNRSEKERDQRLAEDRDQEAALATYLDRMSALLLDKGLDTAIKDSQVWNVARARTDAVFYRLNPARKVLLLRFLGQSKLIAGPTALVDLTGIDLQGTNMRAIDLTKAGLDHARLSGTILVGANLTGASLFAADLTGAYLTSAHLSGATLIGADLGRAVLMGADLTGADLSGANLSDANLSRSFLSDADLRDANLMGADLTRAYLLATKVDEKGLARANSLKRATMPDGSTHD